MSTPSSTSRKEASSSEHDVRSPTTATFLPTQTVTGNEKAKTLLVHKKSPLLITTPPQITRALAFSHPFLLPLSKFLGYLTWSSGDPWESFLLLVSFWTVTLYGDIAIRTAGPAVLVALLIVGIYSRRYSPLSTKSTTDLSSMSKGQSSTDEGFKHQKSLDEIVESLNTFTSRCNVLVEPFFQLTDFLSTQITPTTATTRPALTSLLIRILMILPVWFALSLPPLRIITSKRVVLFAGTVALTWHSRPARTFRTLLWRSRIARRATSIATGLEFSGVRSEEIADHPTTSLRRPSQHDTARSLVTDSKTTSAGVRFTFTVFENQRRWLGLGWTSSMFAYERAAWTDEHLNPSSSKEKFQLPKVESGHAIWQWVPDSEWKVEGSTKNTTGTPDKGRNDGWIYYNNKWDDAKRQDGWGRYTRRRKWFRDAELVEENAIESNEDIRVDTASLNTQSTKADSASIKSSDKPDQSDTPTKRRGFFRTQRPRSTTSSSLSRSPDNDGIDERSYPREAEAQDNWSLSDDMRMGLS